MLGWKEVELSSSKRKEYGLFSFSFSGWQVLVVTRLTAPLFQML